MRSLVVGCGQLGLALVGALGDETQIAREVPWADQRATRRRLEQVAGDFVASCEGRRWLVCWSAGAGTLTTAEEALARERAALFSFIDALSGAPGFDPTRGSFFLASSAGGIYASGDGEVKTELSEPHPMSDYGESKLIQDSRVADWAQTTGVRTMIGRISNLYGPRQNLGKPQGFISHLCAAIAKRTSFTLAVPASTIRDFVYTDDVAARVSMWAQLPPEGESTAEVKILAAGRSVTLGNVVAMTTAVARTPVRVHISSGAAPVWQPPALRFRSHVLTRLERSCPERSLEEGIRGTWMKALRSLEGSGRHN